jgi:phospholipid/cholesterol/gamma-HCH transport system ATP-binding protein
MSSAPAAGGTPKPPPIIRVRDLWVGWGDTTLVQDVSFEVTRGEIFAILGGSGSGKSTLMRYLVGLEEPKKGTIDIAGTGSPDLERGLPPYGVMYEQGALFGSMNVLDNIKLPLEEWTSLDHGAIETIARSKLHLVGLDKAAELMPAELSGGMLKRVAILRALALDPDIAFLDEPSAGLDPVTLADLDNLILTLARSTQLTVVVVTHELDSIFRIADRCLLIDPQSRSVIATGDPRELRNSSDPRVSSFFNPGQECKERSWRPVPTH